MELLDFHHVDNRPVAFEKSSVLLMEPHESGSGTFVRLGPIEHPRDMHLREDFELVSAEVKMSTMDRIMRSIAEDPENRVPFG